MAETTMTTNGRQALARLLAKLSRGREPSLDEQTAQALADELWPDFKAAVAGARAELNEAEAEGRQRWAEARHAPDK